ncbi:NOP5/NOP56 family protein [Geoglobus acetivorans]|uniref:NOP58 family protein n=1 Tax=Geoglobus acetivorans TaxID=565033 RepID=A0ABZ3H5T9_GEOAI|nr:NOP58 family protein [Geoglobus acetivorans]
MKYNLWFGIYKDGKVRKSENLKKSFITAHNPEPLPFSPADAGREVFGDDYYGILRKTAIEVCRELVEKELRREDRYVIALVRTLDELNSSINLLMEKLRDLKEIRESEVVEVFEQRIGELEKFKAEIEKEIEEVMRKIAPNVSEIVGEKIGARLLEKAGSLERLAEFPASTIQVIGAEKSLFKALSRIRRGKKAKVPKHGVIFQHPFIRNLPKKKRGKMARFIANKIAIAARIDYFKGELDEKLSEEVRKKYEQLSRK